MRGFKVAKGFDESSIILPKRQTKNSAGYDFYVAKDTILKAKSITLIPTGVKAYMESDEVLKIYVRSSMPMKKGITLANNVGIIDSDYYENPDNDGHIMIQVMNFSDNDILIKKDERIAQGIFLKYLLATDDDTTTTRVGGFGSTK
ncbi:MAG: dUTP diphosphatase [Acholeplasmatales bacterium]|nr:dUTP diphosphatase [Acholeplasmatales bacterium]